MIAFLIGKISAIEPTFVEVEVHGVGYRAHITLNTFTEIKNREEVRLLTHLHVREDAQVLYGFISSQERSMFLHLVGVNGIGPNTAMVVLSCLSVSDLHTAIMTENLHVLQTIKGIGRKSAQRIVLELKDKLMKEPLSDMPLNGALPTGNIVHEEALAALVALGLSKASAEKSIRAVLQQQPTTIRVEELVKLALKSA